MEKITKKNVAFKYRLGNQWCVSVWSPVYNCYYTTSGYTYPVACALIRDLRQTWNTKDQRFD